MSGKKPKEKLKTSRCEISCPHATFSINMEQHRKAYTPVAESNGKKQALDVPQKLDSEIKLKYTPAPKKRLDQKMCREACLALCEFPQYIEDFEEAAKLLLLIFLSQIFHLLVGNMPEMPAIYLSDATTAVIYVVGVLLGTIQGPEYWKGKRWKLSRPWVVRPQISLGETKPSTSLFDYVGGQFEDDSGKKRAFCYPYISSAMALVSGLPVVIEKTLIDFSLLSLPIMFAQKNYAKGRLGINLKSEGFASYKVDALKHLETISSNCYFEVLAFLRWFCGKKKRMDQWKSTIDHFRPITHNGRFSRPKADEQTEFLCAALALFQLYLSYVSKKKEWITQEEAQAILLWYWRTVLPESAPPEEGSAQEEAVSLAYDSPEVFYQFLTEDFLPTYRAQVLQGATGTQGTMGLLHKVGNGNALYFITPRIRFLEGYAQWLEKHHATIFDLSTNNGGAVVQRKLLEAGIPLKGESGNPATWRFKFYGTSDRVDCFGLPLAQLPKAVQNVFGQLFGMVSDSGTIPTQSEAVPNGQKEAKAL